jgi:hypothetical protein
MAKAAERYGPRWQAEIDARIAEALVSQDGHGAVALEHAQRALKSLGEKAPAASQVRVLKTLAAILKKTDRAKEATDTEARLAKLEAVLDQEYLAKVPPFKPEVFAGRKSQSDRVAVMELFTGAQCPPCVAADVAFDALIKSYKPTEVIFLQYHMHIPGPDPMTNPGTEARWDYYRKTFPDGIRGTPSTVFNGTPQAGGGGGMAAAEKKFAQYKEILDPLLETPAGATIALSAARLGDKIEIKAQVSDVSQPGESCKLHLVLIEENVRYVGTNNLRFHHHVVRALPLGMAGKALTEKNATVTATVSLEELRKQLNAYLDDYATKRPFPHADRPLDLKGLKVVALVQDDQSKEILQAKQAEVTGETAAK